MAYVTETLKSHLADFTSVSQLVSQNEKVHSRWGWAARHMQKLLSATFCEIKTKIS